MNHRIYELRNLSNKQPTTNCIHPIHNPHKRHLPCAEFINSTHGKLSVNNRYNMLTETLKHVLLFKLMAFTLRDPHGATTPHHVQPFATNTIYYLNN